MEFPDNDRYDDEQSRYGEPRYSEHNDADNQQSEPSKPDMYSDTQPEAADDFAGSGDSSDAGEGSDYSDTPTDAEPYLPEAPEQPEVIRAHSHTVRNIIVAGIVLAVSGGAGYAKNRPASAHDKTVAVSTSGSASPKPAKSKSSPKASDKTSQPNTAVGTIAKKFCNDNQINQIVDGIDQSSTCTGGAYDSTTSIVAWNSKDGSPIASITYSSDKKDNSQARVAADSLNLEEKVNISGFECYVPQFTNNTVGGAAICFTGDNSIEISTTIRGGSNLNAQAVDVAREAISLTTS